ncbi:MAG TPA: thioredoxin domain-containing protein [Symbiobacteriaceae bacterium]|nr:thioredoxin domain-containing protein [Symbiobacteriaceae bacterium]
MNEGRPNRLIDEASPYLQQHAQNPVDWYPWGPEALQRAKDENKPIFLSIGYSACHWCHVMEHESFENPEIADMMNRLFVSIKVDREERPDLDQVYQTVCQLVTKHGGWPLSVWLTPDQKPFYVGTYYPPTERYGRPGFKQVLQATARAYHERPDEVARISANWTDALGQSEATPDPAEAVPGAEVIESAARLMAKRTDRQNGGFGGAPKFPNTYNLELMLRQYKRTGEPQLLELVELTLRKMAEGGIYDQLAGGFHRYSVDDHWAVPHFEKMLYDNASLPPVYLAAWQITGLPLYRRIVTETLDYVMREMTHPDGGFYSTTDADSEGEEGKFFVFNQAEVAEAVGPELAELMCRHYGVSEDGNFEDTGKTVLYLAESAEELSRSLGLSLTDVEARLARGSQLMLAYREKRIPPFRDEKILTGWNGLMISAFARAGRVLRESRYTDAARGAADFVLSRLTARNGGLMRRYKDGNAAIGGYIEDYAYFTAALIDLYEATFDEQYLREAIRLTEDTLRLFYDGAGSFYLTQEGAEELIHRPKDALDSSTPAGSSVAVMNLLRLIPFTGSDAFREAAEQVFRTYRLHMEQMPGGMATLLQALDLYLSSPTEVTLVGKVPDEWLVQLGRIYEPNLILTCTDHPRDDAPIWAGKEARGDAPTAYVCRNFACSPPATAWADVQQHLQ